jgi:egghead protein (zeste-white 4 protein)
MDSFLWSSLLLILAIMASLLVAWSLQSSPPVLVILFVPTGFLVPCLCAWTISRDTSTGLAWSLTGSAAAASCRVHPPRRAPGLVRYLPLRLLSAHRLRVLTYMALGVLVLYGLEAWLWPVSREPETTVESVWSWGSLLWLGAVVPGTLGTIGMLMFRHAQHAAEVQPINKLVAWRIVSRGTNTTALITTIRRCQTEMSRTPLFPYVVEVVTDAGDVSLPPPNDDLRYLAVPPDYQTANKSLYKARALQYALEHSPLPDDAWIVHLDEETQPTESGIRGICAMIRDEEGSGALRIGQGALLYHRNWQEHPILTLADNVRTGDDFARFHFQHSVGMTIFGLHGSYIVVRNDVEKAIGFDFGPQGSITEDAFWALVAMERGRRCRWVDGYLEEQSTQSLADFVRQRRRWFQGLVKVSVHAPVKLRWRLSLGLNTFLWSLAPLASLYTVGHLFYGFSHEWWIRFLANDSFASFATLYLVGLQANLCERGIKPWWTRICWFAAQVLLLPVFNLMEGMGVLTAILRPAAGFHVVKK